MLSLVEQRAQAHEAGWSHSWQRCCLPFLYPGICESRMRVCLHDDLREGGPPLIDTWPELWTYRVRVRVLAQQKTGQGAGCEQCSEYSNRKGHGRTGARRCREL